MNKKGFTLIELLVVIALLGILVGFVTVNVLKVYDRQQGKISRQEQNEILRAAEQVITVLEDCEDDLDSELLNSLSDSGYLSNPSCEDATNKLNSNKSMTLAQLTSTGYLSGANLSKYSPNSTISIDGSSGSHKAKIGEFRDNVQYVTNNTSANSILDIASNLSDELFLSISPVLLCGACMRGSGHSRYLRCRCSK